MKKTLIYGFMAATFMLAQACGDAKKEDQSEVANDMNEDKVEAGQTNVAGDDNEKEDVAEFVVMAAGGGMFEMQAAQLAMEKGSTHVKDMAKMIMADHQKSSDELKAIASAKNLTLPAALDEKHIKHLNDLKEKSGKDFDVAYSEMMMKDHKMEIEKFKEAAEELKDPELKAFAAKMLPTLEKHHSMAMMHEDHAEKM